MMKTAVEELPTVRDNPLTPKSTMMLRELVEVDRKGPAPPPRA